MFEDFLQVIMIEVHYCTFMVQHCKTHGYYSKNSLDLNIIINFRHMKVLSVVI